MRQRTEEHMLIGQRCGAFAVEPQHIAGAFERVGDQAARDLRPYGMQLIFEARRHAEIAASAAYAPEQIGFLVLASPDRLPLGGDKLDGYEIVESETMLAYLPIKTAADGEPCNSGTRYHTAVDRQTVSLRLTLEFSPRD